jgi:hypothetical protein
MTWGVARPNACLSIHGDDLGRRASVDIEKLLQD